jgi:hypothetical protein
MIANEALIRLGATPLAAMVAFALTGLGLGLISNALIGRGANMPVRVLKCAVGAGLCLGGAVV